MRVLVTGGAGFLGSHLCEELLKRGDAVICVDDLSTGRRDNIAGFIGDRKFAFLRADVSTALQVSGPLDVVAHLASPASPPDYHRLPLETLAVGSRGTENALQLAERKSARFLLASTSEVYGDPIVHPQTEDYCGNVSSVGPRSVYDEAKRFAEALTMAYARTHGVNVGIIRIFNTFGPRMRAEDGRVVSSFIAQALNGDPLTIYGDGEQTRSFCYVDDLIRGILAMLDGDETGPVNLGNPVERTVLELAELVLGITGSSSPVEFHQRPVDDPSRRRPDITLAASALGWEPRVSTEEGLQHTIRYFRSHRREVSAAAESLAGAQFEGTPARESLPADRSPLASPA
ncbi:UDP-glucuronic acid decarboxylase family protein [Arthrobacter sp. K5]|jgi:dTDP-glucose 4,6-dehydratase|uniref:UDP-glucuronic acid decarboxylase family protein n=1 Tax=Arthrobacter sp. K5 TaxID=2839623 RepID=A0AAU8ETR7_9MICC